MTVGIVGLGLIGGSLAKTIKKTTAHRVLGMDIDPGVITRAKMIGAIDDEMTEGEVCECDILMIALYPSAIVDFLREKSHLVRAGAIVIDCGGIKREICRVGREEADKHSFVFIGGHPMAGREVWGFRHATAALFNGASMILTPDGDIDISHLASVKEFFLSIGFGCVTIRTPDEHDRIIAYTSQLAHILSSAYIKSPTAAEHRGLSAGSFRDMTRVATINGNMWNGIFIENRDYLLSEIDTLIDNLRVYREAVAECDGSSLISLLEEGSEIKKKCFAKEE